MSEIGTNKETQKEQIVRALECLDKITRKAHLLMNTLVSGESENIKSPEPAVCDSGSLIFMEIWKELPQRIMENVKGLNDMLTDLDSKLLK